MKSILKNFPVLRYYLSLEKKGIHDKETKEAAVNEIDSLKIRSMMAQKEKD